MYEQILESDIVRYERQLRQTGDERRLRKLRLLIEATKERLATKREQRMNGRTS
jgi:hypothetical protein